MRATCIMLVSEFVRFMDVLGFIPTSHWINGPGNVKIDSDGITLNISTPCLHKSILVCNIPARGMFTMKTDDFADAAVKMGFEIDDSAKTYISQVVTGGKHREETMSFVFREGIPRHKGTRWPKGMNMTSPFYLVAEGDEPEPSWVNDCEVTIEE